MRRTLIALLASTGFIAVAYGQANNSNTWQTPGNQTVGGVVQLCLNGAAQAVPCGTGVGGAAGYPTGATPLIASAIGTTAATGASLAGAAGKTTYVCGFLVTGQATAASGGVTSINGLIGTGSYAYMTPFAAIPAIGQVQQTFTPCIPASGVNTAIVINSSAPGAGGNVTVSGWGYQL